MDDRLLPNAANLSEFVSGRHGTCGELATLAALHVVRPDAWPLSAASLERIATWEIEHDLAANPSGAEAPRAVAAFLDAEGLRFSTHDPAALPQLLADLAGIQPIIVEYALAEQLPGDERGVHYHYNTCLGRDLTAEYYVFADGDNYSVRVRHGLGPLDKYSLAQIEAAQPVAVILVEEYGMITADMPEVAKYFTPAPDGSSWHCERTGRVIRGGMLPYYRSLPSASGLAGLYELGLPLTDEYPVDRRYLSRDLATGDPVPTCQRFERGVRFYDPQHLIDTPPGGFDTGGIYPAHIDIDPGKL